MSNFNIYAGDTNKTIYVGLRDATTGLAKTGLVYNSAGAVCSYTLPLAARAAITLQSLSAVTDPHLDGGFIEIDATNCKGLYRLDLPDAAIASGDYTIISIEFDGVMEESIAVPLYLRVVDTTAIDALVTTVGTAGAGLTDLGGMSTAMKAEVNAEADTALTDYDAPTKAEMDTAHSTTDALITTVDTVVDGIQTDLDNGTDGLGALKALLDTIDTVVDNILVDTAQIGAAGAGLTDLGGMSTAMKAEVLVEVNAALDTAIAELGVGQPTATPTVRTGLMLLYMAIRNKLDVQTSGTDALEIHDSSGTLICKKTLTDDGSDYSEAAMSSG